MISIKVENVSMNKDLEVVQTKPTVLNGNSTLRKLQNYSVSSGLTNDSIVYLYTTKTPIDKSYFGAAVPGLFSVFSTFGTFCSNVSSAAIIVQTPGSQSHWTTVQGTARVFGTMNFVKFTEEDIRKLNTTLSRCHANTAISKESEEEEHLK
ncbi:uncharacterized protein LOC119464868 [Dermacentor silvarum]|uniref:uncharacterized protein LOC119464868 n=1 Tax=Dermacentor silvarum TaxID=543639 RepID=UPI0021018DEF|nr:uncharacterized protein LOC119464868 [Dermacentor silvarum]